MKSDRTLLFLPLLAVVPRLLQQAIDLRVPFNRPETLSAAGAVLVCGLAFGFFLRWSSRWLRAVALSGLVLFALDLDLGFAGLISSITAAQVGTPIMRYGIAVLLLAVFAGLIFWLFLKFGRTAILASGTFFAGIAGMTLLTLLGSAPGLAPSTGFAPEVTAPRARGDSPSRLWVHILADGLISPDALPMGISGAKELKNEMREFNRALGLTGYDRVFSQFQHTVLSMTALFNGNFKLDEFGDEISCERNRAGVIVNTVARNAYFKSLSDRGYGLRVHQSEVLDFCHSQTPVEACETYGIFNPLAPGIELNFSGVERTVNLLFRLIHPLSLGYKVGLHLVQRYSSRVRVLTAYGSPTGLGVLARFGQAIADAPPSTALFLHLLMPHSPFVWTADCQPLRVAPDLSKARENLDLSGGSNAPEERAARYANYISQARCTLKEISRTLSRPEVAARLSDAVLIVHGDHGSRISLGDARSASVEASPRDLVDHFAAFFAIRKPGLAATPPPDEQISLASLFARLVGPSGASTASNGPTQREVGFYPERCDGRRAPKSYRRYHMPDFGPGVP